jgi:hypothetical protein
VGGVSALVDGRRNRLPYGRGSVTNGFVFDRMVFGCELSSITDRILLLSRDRKGVGFPTSRSTLQEFLQALFHV